MARGLALLAQIVVAIAALGVFEASAQTATQTVHFRVQAVSQVAMAGTAAQFSTKGGDATSSGATYAISTNEPNQKISASIDEPLPDGARLEVHLAAPRGARSAGSVELGTSGADVVTGISKAGATALPITYRFRAPPQLSMARTSRTVTFTVVAGS